MKIYVATVIACWAALTTQAAAEPEWFWKATPVPASKLASTPAPTPAPTKQIRLDYDIVPTWDQLGTKEKTKKIRLWRVYSFWSALEARDKKAVRSLYTTRSEDAAAVAMIDDYYDGAKKCLREQKETQRKIRAEIEAALAEIKSCIASTVAPPTFTILASQSLPSDFYEPVVVDYGDEAAEEEEGGEEMVADTPAITPAAVVMPSAVEVEPTSPVMMTTGTEGFDPHYTGPATGTESNTEPMTGTEGFDPHYAGPATGTESNTDPMTGTEPFDPHYTGPATGTESNTEPMTGTEPFDPHYTGPATGTESNTESTSTETTGTAPIESPAEGTTISGTESVTTETETGPSSESLTMPEPTKPPAEPVMIGTEYHGPIETPNPTFVETHKEETIQPEPIEPVVIQAPQTYVEPVQEPVANTETVQPEPIEPVEIETTTPEFVEPTDPPGTEVSTTEPPVEYPGGTLAPGDEPYIKQEINPPEKPEPFEHELPPVVPTDEPVILTETNAPEIPEPFEHDLPNVGPTEGPVIISEINPPELNPKEANDIKPPHVEVEYENPNGETTAPQDYNPEGEVTIIVPTQEPEVVYETINPETEEPQPPIAVVYSDPSGETTEPEPYHPSGEHVEDAIETETETVTPLIAPVPDSITEPPENVRPDVVAPDPASWPFSPVSPAVPPMWALDIDRSDSVDFDEWLVYLKKLRGIASDAVVTGRDEDAVVLLQTIVDYHYSAFGKCIIRMLKKEGGPMVDAAAFPIVAKLIEDGCNVKFRYSLFAGPPPFEWVAKDNGIVTAKEVEAWFAKRVAQASKDIASKKIVLMSHREHEMIQRVIACTHAQLDANGDAPIHRDAFYAALRKIDECAAE